MFGGAAGTISISCLAVRSDSWCCQALDLNRHVWCGEWGSDGLGLGFVDYGDGGTETRLLVLILWKRLGLACFGRLWTLSTQSSARRWTQVSETRKGSSDVKGQFGVNQSIPLQPQVPHRDVWRMSLSLGILEGAMMICQIYCLTGQSRLRVSTRSRHSAAASAVWPVP